MSRSIDVHDDFDRSALAVGRDAERFGGVFERSGG
jgi:hypothetical protein